MRIRCRPTIASGIPMVFVVLLLPLTVGGGAPTAQQSAFHDEWPAGYLQDNFEQNLGQFQTAGDFVARGRAFTLILDAGQVSMKLRQGIGEPAATIEMTFSGGGTGHPVGVQPLAGVSNYLRTADPAGWVRNVRSYAQVHYPAVYPDIDLVFRRDDGQIEYDFVVAPGGDPKRIRLSFSGIERAGIDVYGDLVLHTASGDVRQKRPRLFQDIDGVRQDVAGGFELQGTNEVGFWIGSFDMAHPLVIDPILVYSTLYGGSRGNQGIQDVATDAAGNAYVVGYFPWDGDRGPADLFVTKFGPNGDSVFRTTFGGWFQEEAGGIALDAAGNIYVTGSTVWTFPGPPPFPTTPDAFQPVHGGGLDAFVTKLDAAGSTILYSTFLGGAGDDSGSDIEVDEAGRIYVAGETNSENFPTAAAWQRLRAGANDAFAAVFEPSATTLLFSTYLGGSQDDTVARLAVSAGAMTIAGTTGSNDFPIHLPVQSQFGGGDSDAFLARLSPAGALAFSSYFGGSANEQAAGVVVDIAGATYVAGSTNSTDLPTANPLQSALSFAPEADAFLAKFAANNFNLVYSTYLGIGVDAACSGFVPPDPCGGVAVDEEGNAYVTAGSPLSQGVFVVKVDVAGVQRVYTYNGFGGQAIALSPPIASTDGFTREIVVAGRTRSLLFPTLNAVDNLRDFFETEEGWVMKVRNGASPAPAFEENDPRISYTGTWQPHFSRGHSRFVARWSNEPGARATITFRGTGIQVIGRRDPAGGLFTLIHNFLPNPDVDTYSLPAEPRSLLVSISDLPLGIYTVVLEVKGTHNHRSNGNWVWIDGFNVLGVD